MFYVFLGENIFAKRLHSIKNDITFASLFEKQVANKVL
jgi:hypothetical protein